MTYIEIDVVEAIDLSGHELVSETIAEAGPNGWPTVRVSGDRQALEKWLIEAYDEGLVDDIIE